MKTLKKMGALLMAFVTTLSLCTTVLAAEATADSAGTLSVNNDSEQVVTNGATVTITGIPAGADVTFSTYQVLYATYDTDSNSLEYHLTDWAKAALVNADDTARGTNQYATEEEAVAALSGITAISTGLKTTGNSATEQSGLVNYLAGYAVANSAGDVSVYTETFDEVTGAAGATGTVETTAVLPVGAYLVIPASDTMAFLNMMVSVDVSLTSGTEKDDWKLKVNDAVLKGSEIAIDKTVSDGTMAADGDTAQAQVGDTLYYSVTADVPKFAEGLTDIVFKVTDTPENLSIDLSSVVVTPYDSSDNAGTALTAYSEDTTSAANTAYHYTASLDSNGVLTVDFSEKYYSTFYSNGVYPYDYVIITYEAELLSSAAAAAGNLNTAELTYGRSSDDTNFADDTTKVYTYQMELTKLGEGGSEYLSGASFKIYTLASDKTTENYLTFVLDSGVYMVADSAEQADDTVTKYEAITTGTDGKVILNGLDSDVTYYIEESVAPAGYTKNTNYLAFTITGEVDSSTGDLTGLISGVSASEYESGNPTAIETYPDTDSTGKGSWTIAVKTDDTTSNMTASISLTVTDTKIISLPSTGGIGTIMFTILGCVIMITSAGLYLVYRRKIRNQQTAE